MGANLVAARRPFRGCAVHAQKQVRANTGGRTALPEHAHKNNFGLGEGNIQRTRESGRLVPYLCQPQVETRQGTFYEDFLLTLTA